MAADNDTTQEATTSEATAPDDDDLDNHRNRISAALEGITIGILEAATRIEAFAIACATTSGGSVFSEKMQAWFDIDPSTASKWRVIAQGRDKLCALGTKLPITDLRVSYEIVKLSPDHYAQVAAHQGLITRKVLAEIKGAGKAKAPNATASEAKTKAKAEATEPREEEDEDAAHFRANYDASSQSVKDRIDSMVRALNKQLAREQKKLAAQIDTFVAERIRLIVDAVDQKDYSAFGDAGAWPCEPLFDAIDKVLKRKLIREYESLKRLEKMTQDERVKLMADREKLYNDLLTIITEADFARIQRALHPERLASEEVMTPAEREKRAKQLSDALAIFNTLMLKKVKVKK